jgi:predicted XRE-type DNA-binding protein
MAIDHSDPIYIMRQHLAAEITRALGGADSQFVISAYYGIPQPRMSELSRGLVERCTIEWLIRRIYRMGGSVTLRVEVGDARRAWWDAKFRKRLARDESPNVILTDARRRWLEVMRRRGLIPKLE